MMLQVPRRRAVSKTILVLALLVLVGALAAVEEISLNSKTSSVEVDLHIYEDDPVLQVDHFYPDTIYLRPNETISLVVQNLDDETRVFALSQYNVNVTIGPGTTDRVAITTNALGNYTFISPITPPSPASQGRQGPCLKGFFEVTQNETLLSTTFTGTGVTPTQAAAAAAAAGPVGSCNAAALTAP